MQQEPITIIVITIVCVYIYIYIYIQLSVQWHEAEWYVITHHGVPCVRLSYYTEHLPEVCRGFLSPTKKNRQ